MSKLDKYEYKLRADEIRKLIQEKNYKEAVEIADTIDWRNVRNSMMLCTISDLYKMCKRFDDSREVLMLAYQRNPGGRMILYSLCELSIKVGDVVNADEFYKEFVLVAPRDPGRLVLRYKLLTSIGASLEDRAELLEELQEYECKEKWMYELAYLYHMMGYGDKCVDECNQIVIYFGEGKYVIKALELKALHEPLSYEQDVIYRRLTGPKENDILVKDMDVSKFNTIDLQKELANSMAEVLFDDTASKAKAEEEYKAAPIYEEPVKEEPVYEEPVYEEPVYEEPAPEPQYEETYATNNIEETDNGQTQIFDTSKIDEALKKGPAVKEVIIPNTSRNLDEMHEVLPKSAKNNAIVFPNYDDMVSMEGDGQISFNIPDEEMVEKQITGQISIEEVLAEWERMKNANERKWRDDMRKKVLKQTNVMFKDFDETSKDGLLEKLETEVNSSETVELTREEVENLLDDNVSHALLNIDIPEEEGEPVLVEEPFEEEHVEIKEPEPMEVAEDSHDIREIFFEDVAPIEEEAQVEEIIEEENPVAEEEPTKEELFFDRTPYLSEENEEADENTAPIYVPPVVEAPVKDNSFDYLMAFAEAGEEHDRLDEAVTDEESEVEKPSRKESIFEKEIFAEEEHEVEEEILVEEEPEAEEEAEIEEESEVEEEPEIEEEPEVEEEPEIEEEPEVEEEPEIEEEPENEEIDESKAYVRASGFTEKQEERFESYIQTESGREQLKNVLASVSMESGKGNLIIGSEDIDSSVELAKAVIMELSTKESIEGKVAKIKASTLNAKDPEETLGKLYNGALIIQDAHELRIETLDAIRKVVTKKDVRIFVILTTTLRAKHRFIMDNNNLLESFNVSMDIEALNNKELASYAKAYAYSKEYAVDEMGMLALHTRIEEKQTNDHNVTVTEVKAMVDAAIEKATKKNVRHFCDVLVGKRYDDNDMVVLKEKDFTE